VSRYWLAPACQGIAHWQAGTTVYQPGKDLFLGEPAQAACCPPVKPCAGAVLPGDFLLTLKKISFHQLYIHFRVFGPGAKGQSSSYQPLSERGMASVGVDYL
jgi:hypothetical protein